MLDILFVIHAVLWFLEFDLILSILYHFLTFRCRNYLTPLDPSYQLVYVTYTYTESMYAAIDTFVVVSPSS